ncbi:cytochrome P450 [Streptomyces sp. NBC_00239]|uniref:cytochrome P450 n=1 Tax=Streptomyces sp. NBC_00239 TaxID=2903640 RepID=UPI002E2C4A4C|nr:cytochrome P450 [Streptomyces sp. NBC_00239]
MVDRDQQGRQDNPLAFISYSHGDSNHHDEKVRTLWLRLRAEGVNAEIDISAAEQPQRWADYMNKTIEEADFILVVASPSYKRRAEGAEDPGGGYGVPWEAAHIKHYMYTHPGTWEKRILKILMAGGTPDEFPNFLGPRQDPAMLERGLIARDELYAYLAPHLAHHRTHPGPGLLSHLCTATVDGKRLSDDMIKGSCGALLGEGAETIDKDLRSMLANLLDHPGEMAALRADPSLIYSARTESLRRDPPLQVIFRETAVQADAPSGPIPAHATVACVVGAANRDPRQFPDPDRFDPRRPGNNRGLAFSAGKHTCFGAQLARLEAEIAIQSLLTTFPRLRWAPQTTRTDAGFPMRTAATLQVSLN